MSLLTLFRDEKTFLENRGAFIIRQLCTLLNSELIFRIFAEIIIEEDSNLKFTSTIVRTLNMILLTSTELFELRSSLRSIDNEVCVFQSQRPHAQRRQVMATILLAELSIFIPMSLQVMVTLSSIDAVALFAGAVL